MIRVLRTVPSLEMGGVEKTLLSLLPELKKMGMDVSVCCLYKRGDLAEEMENAGIPVHFVKMRPRIDFDLKYIQGIARLVALLKEKDISIIHTHMYKANTPGRIAALFARTPVVIANEHNIDTWKTPYQHTVDRILASATSKIIAVSDAVRDFYIGRGIPPEKIITIHNGVDLKKFDVKINIKEERKELGISHRSIVVGSIGRLEPQKGHEYLIDAAQLVKKEYEKVQFLIVGSGSRKKELEEYAQKKGLQNNVIFTGCRNDIPELLAVMDIFALPSLREGFSISLLEAMASGKAIIATSVGGNPEVISDGENGFLVEPRNPTLLAGRITALLRNEELKRRFEKNALYRVKEFSIQKMAEKTYQLYESLLQS